ncbi:MAG: threonine/serine exporter family protein [Anaerolineae bacterium]
MTILDILLDAVLSALVALGFGLLFNVPRRLLLPVLGGGALGHSLRLALLTIFPGSLALSTLIACVVVGTYSQLMAIRYRSPAMIFQVTGAIPMVPGALAYEAVLGALALGGLPVSLMDDPLNHLARNFFLASVLLGAISFGIILPSLLFNRRKPVV